MRLIGDTWRFVVRLTRHTDDSLKLDRSHLGFARRLGKSVFDNVLKNFRLWRNVLNKRQALL
jgi:hypothetical protein